MSRVLSSRHGPAATGALLLVILALPPVRSLLEMSMEQQMLVQYPMLVLAGALLGRAASPALEQQVSAWNAMGLAGLAATMLSVAVLMIPRVLDLAVTDARVEAVKFATLLLVGVVLKSSWRDAGLVVQAFFLGGLLPMTIVVGTLYQDMPLRLCNAYRLGDQQDLGRHLVYVACVSGAVWLVRAARAMTAVRE